MKPANPHGCWVSAIQFFHCTPACTPTPVWLPTKQGWGQDSAQCAATEKTLARAWTVSKPLKAYKPHQSAPACRPQSGASAVFTCSRFDGQQTLQSLQTPPTCPACRSANRPPAFSLARVSSEKNPSKPTKPYQAPPVGWHTDTVFNHSLLAMASGLHGIHAQTNPRKNLSGSLPPAQ